MKFKKTLLNQTFRYQQKQLELIAMDSQEIQSSPLFFQQDNAPIHTAKDTKGLDVSETG